MTVLLDGEPLTLRWPSLGEGEEWYPLRLPVTTPGPHTVSFAMEYGYDLELPIVLQLDAMALLPLTPVSVAEALDAPGLTWTTGGTPAWTGWASAVASPDATDAAWITVPAGEDAVPPFLETTVTGPGTLQFSEHSASGVRFTLSGVAAGLYSYFEDAPSTSWNRWKTFIPRGLQTLRFSAPGDTNELMLSGLDDVWWQPIAAVSVHEALDVPATTALSLTGINSASFAAPALSHDGTDALLVSTLAEEPVSLKATVTGPAFVSFWIQFQSGADFIAHGQPPPEITTDSGGVIVVGTSGARSVSPPQAAPAGEREWSQRELLLPAGVHRLEWFAARTQLSTPGNLLLGVDELRITPLPSGVSLAQAIGQPGWTVPPRGAAGRPAQPRWTPQMRPLAARGWTSPYRAPALSASTPAARATTPAASPFIRSLRQNLPCPQTGKSLSFL